MATHSTVYGIFSGDQCVYVGLTRMWDKIRWTAQRSHFNVKHPEFCPVQFRPLLQISHGAGLQAEADFIRHFRANGQAQLNNGHYGEEYMRNAVRMREVFRLWELPKLT